MYSHIIQDNYCENIFLNAIRQPLFTFWYTTREGEALSIKLKFQTIRGRGWRTISDTWNSLQAWAVLSVTEWSVMTRPVTSSARVTLRPDHVTTLHTTKISLSNKLPFIDSILGWLDSLSKNNDKLWKNLYDCLFRVFRHQTSSTNNKSRIDWKPIKWMFLLRKF